MSESQCVIVPLDLHRQSQMCFDQTQHLRVVQSLFTSGQLGQTVVYEFKPKHIVLVRPEVKRRYVSEQGEQIYQLDVE